jgi:hypothetical protein
MAAAQTTPKRSAHVEVITDGKTVRIVEDGTVRTLRTSNKRDPGLWNADCEWLLCCSSSAVGQRGTMSSVVSTIERGGGPGGGEDPNLAMLRRFGWAEEDGKRPRERVLGRERQLAARYATLPRPTQLLLGSHYLLTPRVDHKIHARCGVMSGVVQLLWLQQRERERAEVRGDQVAKVGGEADVLRAELDQLDGRIRDHRANLGDARRRHGNADERARAFRHRSALAFLEWAAQPLRSALGDLRAREAAIAAAGGSDADLRALVRECEGGEVSELVTAAEDAVRASHAAWTATGRREAEAWVEA